MENMKDEVVFLPANKHRNFLQIDIIILVRWLRMRKLPKVTILLFFCHIIRQK